MPPYDIYDSLDMSGLCRAQNRNEPGGVRLFCCFTKAFRKRGGGLIEPNEIPDLHNDDDERTHDLGPLAAVHCAETRHALKGGVFERKSICFVCLCYETFYFLCQQSLSILMYKSSLHG